jgi:hypothetical protein
VGEWLSFNGYFVRYGVNVAPRPRGGFDCELDIIAFHPETEHLLHVECSLDALSKANRQDRYERKFRYGRQHINEVLPASLISGKSLDQVVVLTFVSNSTSDRFLGGGRLISTSELLAEIVEGLAGSSHASGAIPEHLPLLRTVQLMQSLGSKQGTVKRLVPAPLAS